MNKILTLAMALIWLNCKAQFNIIQYPNSGLGLRPSDVLKADVQNLGGQTSKLYFKGSIVNSSTGELVVSVVTIPIDIKPGIYSLEEQDLSPSYQIYSDVVSQTGNLPFGNYRLCIKAYLQNGVEDQAASCEDVQVSPMSPPLLLSPDNQSVIYERTPLLVWLPPMPFGKEKVVYDLRLVEILPNQTPYDAIQRNFPILEKFDITSTLLQYPANATQLDENKKYAWRVTVLTQDRKLIGETEVWWFSLRSNETSEQEEMLVTKEFVRLKPEVESNYIMIRDELKIIYEEKYAHANINISISELKGKRIESIVLETKSIGDNPFTIDLRKKGLKDRQFYMVEVTSDNRPTMYLVFKFIK